MLERAACEFKIEPDHVHAANTAVRLLAHAAMADAGAAKLFDAEADRAALAAAGVGLVGFAHRFISQVVTISPVLGSFASFSTTPMAVIWSRMRSLSLKSLALRASRRCSIRA